MDSIDVITSLALAITGLVVYFHYKVFTFWSSRGIRGPTPWPIFGTNIYYAFENKIELDLKWKKQYGRTYGLYEGYSPLLRTTDCDLIKEVFLKQFHSFSHRNCQFIHGDLQRRALLWSKGEIWANQRVLISPMFTANKMRFMMPTMSMCIDKFVTEAEKRSKKEGSHEKVSWTKIDLSSLTLDVIASCFFGLKLNTYKPEHEPQDEFIQAAYKFSDFRIVRFIVWMFVPRQLAAYFKFDLFPHSSFVYFDNLSKRIISERRLSDSSKRNDIIQALLDARIPDEYEQVYSSLDDKEAHYNAQTMHQEMEDFQKKQTEQAKHFRNFSDVEVRGQMIFFFAAGFETTAHTLSTALHELANQPEAQAILVDELREIIKGKDGIVNEITYDDLLDMKYLDAFVSELLRLYSPLVENNRVVSNKDGIHLMIDGRQVYLPHGTPVSTNPFIVHRDEDYFKQADKFEMTRFYSENKGHVRTGSFMPFGLGPRHCAGMRFALLEVKLVLARLLSKYCIEPTEHNVHPPNFKQNAIFLQLEDNSFKLVPRAQT